MNQLHPAYTISLGNNQWDNVSPVNALGLIDFYATNPSQPAGLALSWPGAANPSSLFSFYEVEGVGAPGHEVYGKVIFNAPNAGTADFVHGVIASNANITLGTNPPGNSLLGTEGKFILDGNSWIGDNSTLTAQSDRSGLIGLGDPYDLRGSLTVTNNSVADFKTAPLHGSGTINIEAGGTVDLQLLAAGLHANVDKGGLLFLAQPNAAGIINEAAGGTVAVVGLGATHEIFHQASGVLDLLNKSGAQVASLQFAPGSHEYAKQAPGGLMDITIGAAHALPTIFTH
jgi:hypothetical protein